MMTPDLEPVRGEASWEHDAPAGLTLLSVGWLGRDVPSTGDVPTECIDRLVDAYAARKFVSDGSHGWHDCEICTTKEQHCPGGKTGPIIRWRERDLRLYGHGHHLVKLGSIVYMCPVLTLHYILDHKYQPPQEFVTAVVQGVFLTDDDLVPRPSISPPEWSPKPRGSQR